MTSEALMSRLHVVCKDALPFPGGGATEQRHRKLVEIGREDLSLARMAEAHFDALAILAEAGRTPEPGAIYGVWASEVPGEPIRLEATSEGFRLTGKKPFATGATLIHRALVTVEAPDPWLVEVDLRGSEDSVAFDTSLWKPIAFSATKTGSVELRGKLVPRNAVVGERGWYLARPGFWHGACGPAACWAGGAIGLVEYAMKQRRNDPHTFAHLGGMDAAAWSLQAILDKAGRDIDLSPADGDAAHHRALQCRHAVEHLCMDILERFGRAYGPYPLAFVEDISRRYEELSIYIRQCHAERDLDSLGHLLLAEASSGGAMP